MQTFFLFLLLGWIALGSNYNPELPLKHFEIATITAMASLFFLLVNLWSAFRRREAINLPLNGPAFWILLFFLWGAAGYFYTSRLEATFFMTVRYLGAAAFLLGMILHLKRSCQIVQALWAMSAFAAVMAGIGILQYMEFPYVIGAGPFAPLSTGLFINPNFFAGYLLIHIPFCLYLIKRTKNHFFRLGPILFLLALLAGLGLTDSRGGQLTAAFILLLCSRYFSVRIQTWYDALSLKRISAILLLGAALIAVLNFTRLGQFGEFVENLSQPLPPFTSVQTLESIPEESDLLKMGPFSQEQGFWTALGLRLVLWKVAFAIVDDFPVSGSGPWTYYLLLPLFLKAYDFSHTPDHIVSELDRMVHAHNWLLQSASDTGLVGLSLLLMGLVRIVTSYRSNASIDNDEQRSLSNFIFLALVAFFVHNLIEYNWPEPVFIYFFATGVAFMNFLQQDPQYTTAPAWFGDRLHCLNFLSIAVICFCSLSAFFFYQKGLSQAQQQIQVSSLQNKLERLHLLCPRCDLPYLNLAAIELWKFQTRNDLNALSLAEKNIHLALQVSVVNPEIALQWGKLQFMLNEPAPSRIALEFAARKRSTRDAAKELLGKLRD
ncbi:MAG: O-antigen ligase family protein [Candidatus Nitrohelix vancouverensis]|uniref:O-antigen ligase family protein n=1 Tax=Candidatus Nitrohelix vancouverensis TaxID=2705534 RepID=A0A7T0C0K3_9BACT|nr:MAG: O-antigen ligase family protein [Candidatus Nitrohelix vancouverensis]